MTKEQKNNLRVWLTRDFILRSVNDYTTIEQAKQYWSDNEFSELKLWLGTRMIMQWVDEGMSLDEAKELWSDFQVVE